MIPKAEYELIYRIADRAAKLYCEIGDLADRDVKFVRYATADEVLLVHTEVVALRLKELLAAGDGDFLHDITGIHRHIEHGTRERPATLRNCFLPRFANVH